MADENVRFKVSAESDLPKVLSDLDALIRKQTQLGDENSTTLKNMNSNLQTHGKQYDTLGSSITGVKNLMIAAFGVQEIKEAISKIFDLTATYQKYTAGLTVSLGSSQKASEALMMLQNYADKSNFTLDELADTFSKFAGRNVVLGRENMEKLGDVANALQKPFKDLGEAILDINNTERWTELGIKASTAGDKVSLTFKGVTIQAERTEQSVMLATAAFGTLNGVAGQTEMQALTLAGRWSSLEDAAAGLAREAGNGMLPVFEAVIETGIELTVGMKNSAQEGGLLNAVFTNLKGAGVALWSLFIELITPVKELAANWFPSLFGATGSTSEQMKVLALLVNNLVIGPFQVLIMVFREGLLAIEGFYNGLQGVRTGLQGVWAAITGDWAQMGVMFSQADQYFTTAGNKFSSMKDVWDQTAGTIEASNARILNSHQVTAVTVSDITTNLTKKQQEAVAAEEARWAKIKSTLTEGTAQYANAYFEHETNLLKAKDQYNAATLKKEGEKHTQLKDAAKISANELQAIELSTMEQTYTVRQKIIENNAQIEIEKINERIAKHKLTEEAGAALILEIQKKKAADISALEEEKNLKIEELTAKLQAIVVQANQEAGKEVIKINHDMVEKIVEGKMTEAEAEQILQTKVTELRKETAEKVKKIEDETTKIINETRKNQSEATQQILEEWIGNYSEMAGLAMSSFNDYTNSLENMKVSQAGVSAAQDNLNKLITSGKASSEDLALAKKDLAIAQDKEAESAVNGAQASLGLASAIAQVAESIKDYLVEQTLAAYEAINEAIGKTKEVIADFYDAAIENNKAALEIELENFQGSYEERREIIEAYFAREMELAERKDTIVAEMDFQQKVLDTTSDTTKKVSDAWDISKGPIGPAALFKVFTALKEHHAQVLAAAYEREAQEQELRIQRTKAEIDHAAEVRDDAIDKLQEELDAFVDAKEAEIDKAEEAADAQMDALKEKLDAAKDAYKQETDLINDAYKAQLEALKDKQSQEEAAIKATFELKQKLLEQETSDEISAIAILERTRNEALERYRAEEVAKLEATRNRILATLTDEGEREQITNAFAQKIADVHKEVEEAKLDKSKGVSLAIKQLNQEAKDKAVDLKDQEKAAINQMEDEYQAKMKAQADERDARLKQSQAEYLSGQTELNAQLFELLKAGEAREVAALEAAKQRDLDKAKSTEERALITEKYDKWIADKHIEYAIAMGDKDNVLLQEREAREVAALEADKQRELARATSVAERAAITEKYDKQIADKHNEYQDLMGDKDQQTKLAQKELEARTTAEIKALKDQIAQKERDVSSQMKQAQSDYANFVLQANQQILQAEKAMAIAKIRAEIAILRGKRNIFNAGKIDSAIRDLESSISELESVMSGGVPIVSVPDGWTEGIKNEFVRQRKEARQVFNADTLDAVNEAFTGDGKRITLEYTDEDRSFSAFNSSGGQFTVRNAIGRVYDQDGKVIQEFFKGSPWVDGMGYPDGRDTVPAMINKGERILPTDLNEMVGGRELSNEKLVEGYLALEKLKQKFGNVRIEEFGRLNFDLKGERLGTSLDLKGLEKEVKELTNVIRSKPELKINVDANRMSIAEMSHTKQHVTYYENIYNR